MKPTVDKQSTVPTKVQRRRLGIDDGTITKRTKHESPVLFVASIVLCGLLVGTLLISVATLTGFTIPLSFGAPKSFNASAPVAPDFTTYATCRRKYVTNVYNCVDFTNDFAREATRNGLTTWGVVMGFNISADVPPECHIGHAIIITADSNGRYCVVEPQSGVIYGSWQQPRGGDPQIPHQVQADMFHGFGEPYKTGYANLPRSKHTSRNIYVHVFPKGTPVTKDGVAPSGSMTYYP